MPAGANSPDDYGDWFRRVMEAIANNNWDPAIEVFNKASSLHPDNLTYRQMLIACQRKKDQNDQSGGSSDGNDSPD